MTRHGFTDKTFPLELDENSKLVIHVIDGKHDSNHYRLIVDRGLNIFRDGIQLELPFRFNNEQNWDSRDNVHLIIIGGLKMNGDWRGGPAFGFTWHLGKWGGNAVETMDRINDFPNHYLAVVAHELGHAFALDPTHNNIPVSFNGTVIAWGKTTAEWGNRMRLLDFEAALLDSRPIFREIDLQEELPTPNKNEDLGMGEENEADKDKGDPIFVNPRKKLTITWGELKRRR